MFFLMLAFNASLDSSREWSAHTPSRSSAEPSASPAWRLPMVPMMLLISTASAVMVTG